MWEVYTHSDIDVALGFQKPENRKQQKQSVKGIKVAFIHLILLVIYKRHQILEGNWIRVQFLNEDKDLIRTEGSYEPAYSSLQK